MLIRVSSRRALGLGQSLLQMERLELLDRGQRDAEGGQELDEVRQLLLGRLLVDAVDEGLLLVLDMARPRSRSRQA